MSYPERLACKGQINKSNNKTMALKKQMDLEGGYSAEYHRVEEVFYNKDAKSLSFVVLTYKDKASRQAGVKSVKAESKGYEGIELTEFEGKDPVALSYEKLVIPAEEGEPENFFADAMQA